ncbi:MAG: hypothetical protein KDD37_03150 [Bdellovibrionales bacterium]|nr:hypothetical protein [Bdellovibrionales bacterium]
MKLLGSNLKTIFASLLVVVLFGVKSIANDSAPAKESHGESSEGKAEEKKGMSQYNESITVLNGRLEKIRENKERINHLVEEKNHSADQARIGEIISEISELEKYNKKAYRDAQKLQYDIKYRYPEKGEEADRVYKKNGFQNPEDEELSFAEKIDGVLTYAKKVYGPTDEEVQAVERERLRKLEEAAKKANDPKSRFERIHIDK